MIIIDIGANKGLFTDKCLELYPDAKITLVEANPTLSWYLRDKYGNNSNIEVLNNLASNSNDVQKFYINPVADTISTASLNWVNNSRFVGAYSNMYEISVKGISLDELLNNQIIDLIKIDVEGFEYEVIQGLSKKNAPICFEWAEEEEENIEKICLYLKNLGYTEFGYILGDEYMKEPDKYQTLDDFELRNIIDKNRKELWGMIWVK